MEDSLKKRYSIKLISSILNGIIGIVIVAIVPKALGPQSFGQFSYLQQFFTQIMALFDAGTSTAFFVKLSAKNSRKELITFYASFSFFLLAFLLSFIFLVDIFDYLSSIVPDISTGHIYLGLFFGFLTWLLQVYIKISDAYAVTFSVESIKIVHKVVMLLALLYIIHFLTFNLSVYFYFHLFSLLSIVTIITVLFVRKNIYSKSVMTLTINYRNLTNEFFVYTSPIFVFNVIAISISLFDIWLLQSIGGSVETGYYGLSYSIASMCFLFTSALTPIITREFSKLFEENNIAKISKLFKRYVPMLYALAAYFSIFIAFESENLLAIFTDEGFANAYVVLMVMAFYPIHQTYGQLSGSLLLATNQTKLYRNIGLFVSIFGLSFSYLFIYFLDLGAVGFAWKMVLVQIISVNIQLYFNTQLLKISMVPFIMHQLYSLLFFGFLGYLSTSFIAFDNVFLEFMVSGFIYTLLVLLGVILFPAIVSSNKEEVSLLLFKIKNRMNLRF